MSCAGISPSAQPFFAALLLQLFPRRPVVVVTDILKTQESFQQDLETWLAKESKVQSPKSKAGESPSSIFNPPSPAAPERSEGGSPLFYPAWEILPHEGKLPHADVISDRLQTLVALAGESKVQGPKSKVIVTSVAALLQKTFAPGEIQNRTRTLERGGKTAPLDLIEWLEAQGYEPEAQVSQKGEIALRGGIVEDRKSVV